MSGKGKLPMLRSRAAASAAARLPMVQPGSWRIDKHTTAQRGYEAPTEAVVTVEEQGGAA